MFNTHDKSIVVQTRKGSNIPNIQNEEISAANLNYLQAIEAKYPQAQRRSEPTGLYNCHGMTFASRRCFIESASEIRVIISDDDYIEIENILPGDIALYFGENGDVEHSATVIQKQSGYSLVPMVISKWSCHGEFEHPANHCPYDISNIKYYRIIK